MIEDYNVDADSGLIAIDIDMLNADCHINNSEINPIDEILCLLKTEKEEEVTLEHNIILKGIKASIKILKTSAKIIFDSLRFQGFQFVSVMEGVTPDFSTVLIEEEKKEVEIFDEDWENLLRTYSGQYIFQMYQSGRFENKLLSNEGISSFIQAIDSSHDTRAKISLIYTLGGFLEKQKELIPLFEKYLVFDPEIEEINFSLVALYNLLKHVDTYKVHPDHIEKIIELLALEKLSNKDSTNTINIMKSIHKLERVDGLEKWLLNNLDNNDCNINIYNCFSILLARNYYLNLSNGESVGFHQLELMENILTNNSLTPDVYSNIIKLFIRAYEINHSYKISMESINFLLGKIDQFREESYRFNSEITTKVIAESFSLLMRASVNRLISTFDDKIITDQLCEVVCTAFREMCDNSKHIFKPIKLLFSKLIKKATLGSGDELLDRHVDLLDTLYSLYQEEVGDSEYKMRLNIYIALEFAKLDFSSIVNNSRLTDLVEKIVFSVWEESNEVEKQKLDGLRTSFDEYIQNGRVYAKDVSEALLAEVFEEKIVEKEPSLIKKEFIDILHRLYPETFSANFESWPKSAKATKLLDSNNLDAIKENLIAYRKQIREKEATEKIEDSKNIDELLAEIRQYNLGNSYISDELVVKIFGQYNQILDIWKQDSTIFAMGKNICDWGEEDIRQYSAYFQANYLGVKSKSWSKQAIKSESREELLNAFKQSWLKNEGQVDLLENIEEILLHPEDDYILELLAVIKQANIIASGKDPRDIQMLSILLLLSSQERGLLLQINTGEGKSIITAMLAAVKAMQGEPVDVITSSSILAKRDAEDPEKQCLFNMLGLTVSHNTDKKRGGGVKECYLADIVYGDVSSFQYDLIDIELNKSDIKNGRQFGVVIVDEVDSMLIDESAKIAMISRQLPGSEFLQPIYSALWTNLLLLHKRLLWQDGNYFVTTGIFEEDVAGNVVFETGNVYSYDEEEQEYLLIAKSPTNLDIDISDQEISKIRDFRSFEKDYIKAICQDIIKASKAGGKMQIPTHLEDFAQGQMDRWVKALLDAKSRSLNKDYVVVTNEEGRRVVSPVDFANTGIIANNTQWSNGLHQILQVKELLKLSSESLITAYISNMGYFQNYGQNIYGLTGTLGSLGSQELLKDTYNVDLGIIPTFKEKKFEELPSVLVTGQIEHDAAILESIQEQVVNNRAVLVICDTIFKAQNLHHSISNQFPELSVKLYSRTDNEESMAVDTRISCKDIIVATNLAGRGTDLKTTPELEEHGGLHVCLTYLPSNQRVEDQAFGRTSRQGNYGSGELIINLSEALLQINDRYFDIEDIEAINVLQLKQLRHAQEEDRLLTAKLLDVNRIKLEDDLFKDFCALHQSLKLEENHREKLMQVQELWGLLLKQIKAGYTNDDEFPLPQISHIYEDNQERAESYNNHQAIKAKAAFDIFAERMKEKYNEDFAIFENHNYLVQYANNHMKSGELSKSIEALEVAIKVDTPYKHNAYYYKAYALISKESIECARSGKASHNNNAEIIYSLLQAKDLINSYIIPHIQSINITIHEVGYNDLIKQSQDKIKLYETYVEHIEKVLSKIQNCANNNYIAIDNIKFLEEYFPDDKIPHYEIKEMAALGLLYIFDVKEVSPPVDWGTCFMLAALAVMQIGVGILCACSGNLTIATSLVLSGLSDFEKCYNVANGELFSWDDYFSEKAITIGVTLLTIGAQNLTSTLNLNWLSPLELATNPLANLAINVASAYTLNKGLDAIKDKQIQNIVKELRGEIRREIDNHLNVVFSDKIFLENIETLLIFDSVQSNNQTGQGILSKVEEVLVNKTNKINAFLKAVLHSVAKQANLGSAGGAVISIASYASKAIDIAGIVEEIKETIQETCFDIQEMVSIMASQQSVESMLNDSITIASKEEIRAIVTLLQEKNIINEFGQLDRSKIMKPDGIKETTAWEMLNFPGKLSYLQSRVKGKIRSLYASEGLDYSQQIEHLRDAISINMQENIQRKVSKGVAKPLADIVDDYTRPHLIEKLKVISKNVTDKILSQQAKNNLIRMEEKFGEKSKEYLDNIRSAIGQEEKYEEMYNKRSEEIAKHQAKINEKYEQRQLNGINYYGSIVSDSEMPLLIDDKYHNAGSKASDDISMMSKAFMGQGHKGIEINPELSEFLRGSIIDKQVPIYDVSSDETGDNPSMFSIVYSELFGIAKADASPVSGAMALGSNMLVDGGVTMSLGWGARGVLSLGGTMLSSAPASLIGSGLVAGLALEYSSGQRYAQDIQRYSKIASNSSDDVKITASDYALANARGVFDADNPQDMESLEHIARGIAIERISNQQPLRTANLPVIDFKVMGRVDNQGHGGLVNPYFDIDPNASKPTILSTPNDSDKILQWSQLPGFMPEIRDFGQVEGFAPSMYKTWQESFPDQSQDLNDFDMSVLYKDYPNTVEKINNRHPINGDLAGKQFPLSEDLHEIYPNGVWFKENGCPDFTPYADITVEVEGLTGNRKQDAKKANEATGFIKTPKDMTWHHVEDGKTMQLVPEDLHEQVKHTGGAALLKNKDK